MKPRTDKPRRHRIPRMDGEALAMLFRPQLDRGGYVVGYRTSEGFTVLALAPSRAVAQTIRDALDRDAGSLAIDATGDRGAVVETRDGFTAVDANGRTREFPSPDEAREWADRVTFGNRTLQGSEDRDGNGSPRPMDP